MRPKISSALKSLVSGLVISSHRRRAPFGYPAEEVLAGTLHYSFLQTACPKKQRFLRDSGEVSGSSISKRTGFAKTAVLDISLTVPISPLTRWFASLRVDCGGGEKNTTIPLSRPLPVGMHFNYQQGKNRNAEARTLCRRNLPDST